MPPKKKKKATTTTTTTGGGGKAKKGKKGNPKQSAAAAQVALHPLSNSYPELLERKQQLDSRLHEIKIPPAPPSSSSQHSINNNTNKVPIYNEKIDTHHDFMLKELQWLSDDFSSERKRHISLRRKISNSIKSYFATQEVRYAKKLADAELKRKKLAARIGRDVMKNWWSKLEKVVTYKQKLEYERQRRNAMNKQLVQLVKVTEKYTETLTKQQQLDEESDEEKHTTAAASAADTRRKKYRRRRSMSVEEALAEGLEVRKSKARVTDYARLTIKGDDNNDDNGSFYGESTASDRSSDSSYMPGEDSDDDTCGVDDETSLIEAERDETLERRQRHQQHKKKKKKKMGQRHEEEGAAAAAAAAAASSTDDDDNNSNNIFQADPIELLKLKEESTMNVQDVVQRLQKEAAAADAAEAVGGDDKVVGGEDEEAEMNNQPPAAKRVKFSDESAAVGSVVKNTKTNNKPDPGEDADDDADASDVEDFVDIENNEEDDEEFKGIDELDDETTMEQEESLPQEMSRQQEIQLLEEENEMSVEELRKLYAGAGIVSLMPPTTTNMPMDEDDGNIDEPQEQPQQRRSRRRQSQEKDEKEPGHANAAKAVSSTSLTASLLWPATTTAAAAASAATAPASQPPPSAADDDGGGIGGEGEGEDEFQPNDGDLVDDETTMEAEERLGRDISYEDELALLKRESEMSVEELRAMYANADAEQQQGGCGDQEDGENGDDEEEGEKTLTLSAAITEGENSNNNDDGEYQPPAVDGGDDETTIEAEERMGREMSVEDEIALLKKESEEPVESLVEQFRKRKREEAGGEGEVDDSSENEEQVEEGGDAKPVDEDSEEDDDEDNESDAGRAALDALEKSAERARRARATRPYMLAPWVKLRAYQQVGLNWLVSLHSRRLNGVLADQMGLGKTLQTIALLAYLAAYKGIWGPHLIVVPTSVLLNWETELKRFCPALKVLCYYGPAKRRKELRSGWTKTNWYHVVITSYQIAVQDAFAFKRKKWYYLVLDEAQNIKNFQSQRWQTLINFNTQRRLLLSGTPLQNNLMELWSLLHFLMPYIFRSRKEFSYWFANPMTSMIEGSSNKNDDVVNRLHGIIRPFLLRRLKKDVETQMPGKFEHVIKCQLSRRQMFIYEEFLARSSTRQALAKGGNFMGMMNVLMQLRKVCNHPDLFEPRAVVTPFVAETIRLSVPACVVGLRKDIALMRTNSVSINRLLPLWCGSAGLASSEAALRHDSIEAEELYDLMDEPSSSFCESCCEDLFGPDELLDDYPPALRQLLTSLNETHQSSKKSHLDFLMHLNSSRCRSSIPFAYPSRLIDAVNIGSSASEQKTCSLTTPAALLTLMRKDQQERAEDMDEMIKKFVFCVPSASARQPILDCSKNISVPGEVSSATLDKILLEPVEELFLPFQKVQARLSSSFPDKSLIQFDAGKLQTLAELLRELKRGGHRALIFTQMSKMLDILEAFLNLNGHTYLRLDGSTGVDRRQRLMDRFNNDPKIFCFILSTRSGGLGINLTGADTVVFYDQDWNPAMDAQAQDRAHRIGQTREVHIYRLVTEHSIEENILIKAQQKRNLDILVMDEGKFDASQLFSHDDNAKAASDPEADVNKGMYTEGGLRAILGAGQASVEAQEEAEAEDGAITVDGKSGTDTDMEKAMASLEDVDDVQALRGAQKEAAEELREFDESTSDSENEGEEPEKKKKAKRGKAAKKEEKGKAAGEKDSQKKEEEDLEKEFAAWQDKVGLDASAIEASLSPAEKYGLRFREEIDPYYSIFAVLEYRRKMEAEQEVDDEVDVGQIEREKAREEKAAMDDGDLLGTRPRPQDLIRQRNLYRREKAKLRADKKRRKLTGENWELRSEALTKYPFWYNIDTGEGLWDKPATLLELEAYEKAQENLYTAMPMKPLIHLMSFLLPLPDRMNCAAVCRQWKAAAVDPSFVRHVYPVEMGAYTRDESKMHNNHYRSIRDALANSLPGDTIELGDGHYWEKEDLLIDFPLRIVGDENNAANVVVEMSGTLTFKASGGWMEGVTFRRPKMSSGGPSPTPILSLEGEGRIDMIQCVFDNGGSTGDVVKVRGSNIKGKWEGVAVKGGDVGIAVGGSADLLLDKCGVYDSKVGVCCCQSTSIEMTDCELKRIDGVGFEMVGKSRARLVKCRLSNVSGGILKKESGCTISCSQNTITKSTSYGSVIPGFRQVD